jgi:hypothetical protein
MTKLSQFVKKFNLRKLPVMANLMCKLVWAKGCQNTWLNIISGYAYDGVSGRE